MIQNIVSQAASTLLRKSLLLASCGLAALSLASAARADAVSLEPSTVIANDSYSVNLIGYNSAAPGAFVNLITLNSMANFGQGSTLTSPYFTGAFISSVESIYQGVATDTFILTGASNFVPAGTRDKNGNIIDTVVFAIGQYNGGTNTVDYNSPLLGSASVGAITVTLNIGTVGIGNIPVTMLTNGNRSYSAQETFTAATGNDISAYDITAISLTLTYAAAVPEPSSVAMVALGVTGLGIVIRRRRSSQA